MPHRIARLHHTFFSRLACQSGGIATTRITSPDAMRPNKKSRTAARLSAVDVLSAYEFISIWRWDGTVFSGKEKRFICSFNMYTRMHVEFFVRVGDAEELVGLHDIFSVPSIVSFAVLPCSRGGSLLCVCVFVRDCRQQHTTITIRR